jgi:XXXCH domain-containing protein
MASKKKYNLHLSRPEAADLLRKLADTLEAGCDEVATLGVSLAELAKFKIRIDLGHDDSLEVKFTGTGFAVCGGAQEPCGSGAVCESLSSVKKRMQVYFKALRESVARGEMPSREIVSVFLADSERMTSLQSEGDEAYVAWAVLCTRLRAAFDAENLADIAAVAAEMAQARKDCHARFK